ncbi:MAG: ELM1/GtrOC1 family putative glycosyltransferase [Candidatus Omnitrophica bacterium]|nr:ELM1/GtrOC1 family putative glycosyltransferase [Candidatus Omnitrophota bacterium]
MKRKDFLIDYCAYILFRIVSLLIRSLPLAAGFWIGRRLGDLWYLVDLKHRAVAYANIKTAFGAGMTTPEIRRTTRRFFRAFGQNVIEIFLIPRFDGRYVASYVSKEGEAFVQKAFARGKGIIFVAMHAGGWELANIVALHLGLPFRMFVREQKFPRLEGLLNSYRRAQGTTFISREHELRQLVRVLQANESVAMTIDQGGRTGTQVRFFGKNASMASGAVRLALKLDCALVPVIPVRIRGPYIKFIAQPEFKITKTGNEEKDVAVNLQGLAQVFEKLITQFPHEYLWTYKIWKYSSERTILILSDAKAGHLRQSQSLAKIAADILREKGLTVSIVTHEVKFKNGLAAKAVRLANCLSGKYICQGCLWCLRACLDRANLRSVLAVKPDIIISAGSSLVPINYQLAGENQALSFVIMRPSFFSTRRFDLVVMPGHDSPPKRKNVVVTNGALNLIDEEYLAGQKRQLIDTLQLSDIASRPCVGLLLGGDSKDFSLGPGPVNRVLGGLQAAVEKTGAWLLITTSRRTPPEVEAAVRHRLKGFSRTKLLVIANERNYPFAVGGIIGSSSVIVTSPESISMISEACSSGRQVVVFDCGGLSGRHRKFLDNLERGGYINLVKPERIEEAVERVVSGRAVARRLDDNVLVREALKKIL